ncbi:hypothetical protein Hanom_Chr14g01309731 [Helianthus anomalus]
MVSILHHYGFHISQMSLAGMVRVRHFEFLCRSQGLEPTVEKFRAFYQLIRNMCFYSFGNRGATKKNLISPPKSFHDGKMKFFVIREEVMPITMIFLESDKIEKKELPIPKGADWYMHLLATPNRIFGEQVLVAAAMSNKWPERSEELYQDAFPTFGGSMGAHPLAAGEVYWYEPIKGNFLFRPAGAFANPPTATEGAQLPKLRHLCGVTFAGNEILFLSNEESVGSSQEELSSWSNIFAGVLCDLGIDPEERPEKAHAMKKTSKKVTVDTGATSKNGKTSRATAAASEKVTLRFRQSNLKDYVITSDSLEGLSRIVRKKSSAAGSKSFVSAGSRSPEVGATPYFVPKEEKRSREETADAKPAQKVVVGTTIGKQNRLRSLYKFSPEALKKTLEKVKGIELEKPKELEAKKPKFVIKPPRTTEKEAERMFEESAGDVIPEKEKSKETETVATTKQDKAQGPEVQRGEAPHQPVWGLKQKDTFVEFGACRDWFLGSFPPGEVNRQRARNHEGLYHAYVIGEANALSANHQIVREWRTAYKERASWEKYRERLVKDVQDFEQLKNKFVEEKASFEAEKKAE